MHTLRRIYSKFAKTLFNLLQAINLFSMVILTVVNITDQNRAVIEYSTNGKMLMTSYQSLHLFLLFLLMLICAVLLLPLLFKAPIISGGFKTVCFIVPTAVSAALSLVMCITILRCYSLDKIEFVQLALAGIQIVFTAVLSRAAYLAKKKFEK